MTLLGFAAVLLLVLANAFFVAIEFGLVAVDRNQLQKLADDGSRAAIRAAALQQRLSYNLSGAQLGITICSLGLGVLAEPVVAVALEPFVGNLVHLFVHTGFDNDSISDGVKISFSRALLSNDLILST